VYFSLGLASAFAQTSNEVSSFKWYRWNEGVNAVQFSGKFMLIDVYTDWCGWCKKMDRDVYRHTQVRQLLDAGFIPVKLNAESSSMVSNGGNQYTEQELSKMLNVESYPTTLVFNSKFQLVSRFSGYREPDIFIRYLKYIRGKHYLDYSFNEYLERGGDK
jgi:thioredoxin-related protein